MTASLAIYGALGIASIVLAAWGNRHLFVGGGAGRVTVLEATYYALGIASLVLGWYFNVRYTHAVGSGATYVNFTKALFANWAADSEAQDYIIVNLALFPLWSISEGRRKGVAIPWIFFVMSLFTSLAFAVAAFLAVAERQNRWNEAQRAESSTSKPQL